MLPQLPRVWVCLALEASDSLSRRTGNVYGTYVKRGQMLT